MAMTEVKICGLKTKEHIKWCNESGPDYVGFVFAPSKRQVNPKDIAKIIPELRESIKKVGVFVNSSIEEVLHIAELCELQVVQLHGDEDLAYIKEIKKRAPHRQVWKAVSVKDHQSVDQIQQYRSERGILHGFLFDAHVGHVRGGSGKTFNWELLDGLDGGTKIILAGGLGLHNIERALNVLNPNIVDVSSGVERDGEKDKELINSFIERVRTHGGK